MIIEQRATPSSGKNNIWEVWIAWTEPAGPAFRQLPSIAIPAFSLDHARAIADAINSFAITMEVKP